TADFQSAPAWSLMRVQILSALRQGTPSRLKVGGTAGSKACATDGHQSRLPPIYPPTPAGSSLVATLTILNCLACSAEWARTVSSRNVAQTFRLPYRRLSVCSGMEPDARANSQRPPAGHAQPTESRRYSRLESLRYGRPPVASPTDLPSHAGQFFVGRSIDDLKLLGVQRGVGADRLPRNAAQTFSLPYRRLSVCSGMEPDARANSQRPPAARAQPTESRRYSRLESLRYGRPPISRRYGLPTDAGQFFIRCHVDDLELFGMKRRVRSEQQPAKIALLHFLDMLFVFGAETLQDAGMNGDAQLKVGLVARTFLQDFTQLALDLDTHGQRALDLASPLAIGAIVVHRRVDALGMPLAGHLH